MYRAWDDWVHVDCHLDVDRRRIPVLRYVDGVAGGNHDQRQSLRPSRMTRL